MFAAIKAKLFSLKDWVESKANHPHAEWYLFIIAFTESSFFPIPPDFLLIPLAVLAVHKAFRYALICTIGSVAGGMLGYAIGIGSYELIGAYIINFLEWLTGKPDLLVLARTQFDIYGIWAVIIAGFTPVPYKVFTIAAGFFEMNFWEFVLASIGGRGGRFFLVAGFIFFVGPTIKTILDKYFDKVVMAATVLLILGFISIKYLT